MRVNSIGVMPYAHSKRSVRQNPTTQTPEVVNPTFKGKLKFGDYIAGGVGGTVMGLVAATALGPLAPLGIIVGAFAGKTIAETNNETRKDDDDKK